MTHINSEPFKKAFDNIPYGTFALIIVYDGRAFQQSLEKFQLNCKCLELGPVLMIDSAMENLQRFHPLFHCTDYQSPTDTKMDV